MSDVKKTNFSQQGKPTTIGKAILVSGWDWTTNETAPEELWDRSVMTQDDSTDEAERVQECIIHRYLADRFAQAFRDGTDGNLTAQADDTKPT